MRHNDARALAAQELWMSHSVLIIEDDDAFRQALLRLLADPTLEIDEASSGEAGLRRAAEIFPDLVLMDYLLPDLNGLDVLERLRVVSPTSVVVLLTAHGSIDLAVEAMRRGAHDFVLKGSSVQEIQARIMRCLETVRLQRRVRLLHGPKALDRLLGASPPMRRLRTSIEEIAAAPTTSVLVLGETGVGKELVAKAIHDLSARAEGPFVAANCTAIPASLAESEFFGHERGAFTGADRRRQGLFEVAHGGTLLLDEVGDLDLALQVKLLRVLDEKAVRRVGGAQPVSVDVRVIAATNRDLQFMVHEGRFRLDLFYRLNQFTLRVPPLRDRGDDVVLLARQFANAFAAEMRKAPPTLAADVEERLSKYPFPGNVRELRNLIEQAVIRSTSPTLALSLFPALEAPTPRGLRASQKEPMLLRDVRRKVRERERDQISEAIESVGGHLGHAAKKLGISRYALRRKLQKHGMGDLG